MQKKLKIILASVLGTAMEFYDFTLFGVFSVFIADYFFDNQDKSTALLFALLCYATGSFMKPVGGFIFGYLGDKVGRKSCLLLSLLLMAFSTLLIGILPGHKEIGMLAPFALIFCRLLQGLSAGGEFNNATIFLMEHLGSHRKGFAGSLVVAGGTIGTLAAMTFGAIVMLPNQPDWAWRLPFILGALVACFGYYIRQRIEETPEFISCKNSIPQVSKRLFFTHTGRFVQTICIGGFASALAFTIFNYLNIYLNTFVHFDMSKSMSLSTYGLVLFIMITPAMGHLSDRFSPKFIMSCSAIMTFLSIYPIYLLLATGNILPILVAQTWLVLLSSSFSGPMSAHLMQLFDRDIRCTSISLGFTLGVALFGGTMPVISTYLINLTGNILTPSFYLMFCAIIAIVALRRENPLQFSLSRLA